MSKIALTRIVFIRHILNYAVSTIDQMLGIRLVNSSWANTVERYDEYGWENIFGKYREKED